jgi:TatA/E family protein of Tat protein translocase
MGTLGTQEIIVIFVLALVLFGPKKLPELGRTIGKALTEFRRHSNDLKATFEREMHNLERESEQLNQITQDTASEVFDHATRALPAPAETAWNPLNYEATALPSPATPHGPASSDAPTTVGASAVTGAESNGTTATAVATEPEFAPAIEGTVPRTEAGIGSEKPQHS